MSAVRILARGFGVQALAAAALVLGVTAGSLPAHADHWGHGWGWHGPHGWWHGRGWGYGPPAVIVAPPAVVMAPPVMMAPPPVVMAPPMFVPPSLNFFFGFR